MHQHVDGGFARDAALLGEQHPLGERQHLHGQAEVGRDLHHEREAVVTDVRHLRADVVEDRLDLVERRLVAADHHRQLSLLQRDDAARHGGVDHVAAFLAHFRGERAADRGTHRAHVDDDLAGRHGAEQAVGSVHHGFVGG